MIPNQRDLFGIPDGVAYLNLAYMSPLPAPVRAAGIAGVDSKRTPWATLPEHFFGASDRARAAFARLVNGDVDGVALVPSVSYAIATAIRALPTRTGAVLVLADQFPSHVYPWRRLTQETGARLITVPRPADMDWTQAILDALAAHPDIGVVAVPNVHWTDGGLIDLVRVGEAARFAGAALVIDGTQSFGAMAFDVAAVQPDAIAAGGYKWLMGPYSYGFAWFAPHMRGGVPLEEGWVNRAGSEDFRRLVDYQDAYQPGARRYDVGERSNFILAPMAEAALTLLLDWGVPAIAETLSGMTDAIAERAEAMGLSVAPRALRGPHMLGLTFPEGVPDDLPQRLAAEQVYVSVRGDAVRVGPHLHVTEADIDKLFNVLAAVRGGREGRR